MSNSKKIEQLAEDIYVVLDPTKEHTHDSALAANYAMRIGGEFAKASLKRDAPRVKGKLWASDLGKKCMRQHWYNFNEPEKGEPLNGHTKFKFLYGNVLEEAVLYFAEEAGHSVRHGQHVVEGTVDGWSIRGRIDGVVDRTLVDVKSTSSFGFKRYKEGIDDSNDSFGYLYQLGFYVEFNDFDPNELEEEAGFIWIDKQNGHIHYTRAETPDRKQIIQRARDIIKAVDKDEKDVAKQYAPKPYGKSGNMSLDTPCSYCPYKANCWRDSNGGKGLQGYLYSHGPVWFTDITRAPRATVPQIDVKIPGDDDE